MDAVDGRLTEKESACARRVLSVWEEAVERYQLREDIRLVLRFRNNKSINRESKGHTVGRARTTWPEGTALCEIELNKTAIEQCLSDMLGDTIPHEIAHLVCHLRPYLGYAHNDGWRTVCKALGGTGEANFSTGEFYDLRVRKRYIYLYDVPGEGIVRLSDVKHNRTQKNGRGYLTLETRTPVLAEYFTGERE